ncbi:hypothetical protein ACWG0P_03500 [Amedibacillus sp. YH-ame6]
MNMNKNRVMSRKYVVISLLVMILGGVLFGAAIMKCFKMAGIISLSNLSICIILYVIVCIFCWMPLIVPANQIAEMDENTVYIIPQYSTMKKLKIAWYTLINDTMKPFYRSIPIASIDKLTFTFQSQWGAYAYKRFSFELRLQVGEEKILVYINPGQNGPIIPSGYGVPFAGTLTREEIANLIGFFRSAGVQVADPYKLEAAMKDENVVLYDYLDSLNKKIRF